MNDINRTIQLNKFKVKKFKLWSDWFLLWIVRLVKQSSFNFPFTKPSNANFAFEYEKNSEHINKKAVHSYNAVIDQFFLADAFKSRVLFQLILFHVRSTNDGCHYWYIEVTKHNIWNTRTMLDIADYILQFQLISFTFKFYSTDSLVVYIFNWFPLFSIHTLHSFYWYRTYLLLFLNSLHMV